ncbi:hypothetical protein CEP51_008296 [Fusarium floridanum]|uniref:Uncharacterized protein n=1 Tax=Fusarium floridanum TaxID=1325733 RepID=A0A428RLD6_9HYPO|nr:hypothetical protein CEP51_008296 [Fusarium floridanum]
MAPRGGYGERNGMEVEWKRKLSGDQTQHEEFTEEAILGHDCPRLPASNSKARQGKARQDKTRGRCWIRYGLRLALAPEHPIYDPIFSFYSAVSQLSGDLEHGATTLSEVQLHVYLAWLHSEAHRHKQYNPRPCDLLKVKASFTYCFLDIGLPTSCARLELRPYIKKKVDPRC